MASWWNEPADLTWPDITVKNKIKKRAKAFHDAGIDSVINYGLHMRFDFSDYFQNYHGYMNEVCAELHKYGIKFIDHYSCNLIERPRDQAEFEKLHRSHRHHVLLHKDFKAAEYACYEGHMFRDICEVDLRDGSRGYTPSYQTELFCHNNPGFLDMHKKYLERLVAEVDFDAIEVDDMCEYGSLAVCGCEYCRERFRREYGLEIPPLSDKSFWGDISGHPNSWGNYENPAFRDYLRMRTDSVLDHIKMVRSVVSPKPLFTCCSATGPMYLNPLALDLEKNADSLDIVMLENCGLTCSSTNWVAKDAEAMQQRDIAKKMGNAPAIALSYTTFEDGAYLGWALARFWGAGNWASTMPGRLDDEPEDLPKLEELMKPIYTWESSHSPVDPFNSEDIVNVRLVNSRYNRENGYHTSSGADAWSLVNGWAQEFVLADIGYRFVRFRELASAEALLSETTPIVVESCACVSEAQFAAVKAYLQNGGIMIIAGEFGIKDEKGFAREKSFSDELKKAGYKGLVFVPGSSELPELIKKGIIKPLVNIIAGDKRRVFRAKTEDGRLIIHIMNTGIVGIPHKWISTFGTKVLDKIENVVTDHEYEFEIYGNLPELKEKKIKSPEFPGAEKDIFVEPIPGGYRIKADLSGSGIYAVIE